MLNSSSENKRKGNKQRNKKRSNRNHSSAREKFSREDQRTSAEGTDARNDISWYSRNPNLLQAAGRIPFPYRPGMTIHLDNADSTFESISNLHIPGAMTLQWKPSVGYSDSATDPISVAAKEIYARVRASFSGALEADAPDFVIDIMALDSLFAYIAWVKRVYRSVNAFTPENYFTPNGLLQAMGFSIGMIEQLRQQKLRLWQIINTLVLQSRKFTCPALMDVINRHYWMSDNVYTDSASINSQFYVFNPVALYRLDTNVTNSEGVSVDGLSLVPMPWTHAYQQKFSSGDILTDIEQYGNSLIQAIVAWDSGYTISGYLARAYEGAPSFMVEEIPFDAVLTPVYDEEVLLQIQNAETIPSGLNYSQLTYDQWTSTDQVSQEPSNNIIVSRQITTASGSDIEPYRAAASADHLLNVRADQPTLADVVVATRLKSAFVVTSTGSDAYEFQCHSGTEQVLWFTLIAPNGKPEFETSPYSYFAFETYTFVSPQDSVESFMSNYSALFLIEHFDWHPICVMAAVNGTTAENDSIVYLLDVDNITRIDNQSLQNLNRVCLFSEFNAFAF